MDMTGEYRIAAPREKVWEALNDPEILAQCIPGCEEIVKLSDTDFTARVMAEVGPVKARFTGKLTLSDLDPPTSYKISGEVQGGDAGFAKGAAQVRLEDDGGATVLRYTIHATVGGKLAQIGAHLIDGAARKMADEFFGKFTALVGPAEVVAEAPAAAAPSPAPAEPERGLSPLLWIAGVLAIVAILLLVFGG